MQALTSHVKTHKSLSLAESESIPCMSKSLPPMDNSALHETIGGTNVPEPAISVNLCEKSSYTSASTATVSGKQMFSCDMCGRKVKTSSALLQHKVCLIAVRQHCFYCRLMIGRHFKDFFSFKSCEIESFN